MEVTCHKQSRPRQLQALGSREDHRALIFHKHFVHFIFYARKTQFCAISFFLAELLFNSESRPPGWTDSQDWESSRLLNSTSFLTHNLGGEVVDLVDLEHLHFLLLHFLCLTSFLLQLLGRWHCQLSLQKLAIEGWKGRRHPFLLKLAFWFLVVVERATYVVIVVIVPSSSRGRRLQCNKIVSRSYKRRSRSCQCQSPKDTCKAPILKHVCQGRPWTSWFGKVDKNSPFSRLL